MQIILTRDEYLDLQPNQLRIDLIDKIKEVLDDDHYYENEAKVIEIREQLGKFDKKANGEAGSRDPLWPAEG